MTNSEQFGDEQFGDGAVFVTKHLNTQINYGTIGDISKIMTKI